MAANTNLTAERMRERLEYDPLTGVFRWRQRASQKAAGSIAGSREAQGYWVICLYGRFYKAHRLAWLHVHGQWPTAQIDHIDGDRANNALANLREVTNAQNQQNRRGPRSDNKLGVLGVYISHGKFKAQIRVGGKTVNLGVFTDVAAAGAAYQTAKRELHVMAPK